MSDDHPMVQEILARYPAYLRERRAKLDLTQKETADRIGVTTAAYNRWEKGKREPSFRDFLRTIVALDSDPAAWARDILGGRDSVALQFADIVPSDREVEAAMAGGLDREAAVRVATVQAASGKVLELLSDLNRSISTTKR